MSAIKRITFNTLGEANREAQAKNNSSESFFFVEGQPGGRWVVREMTETEIDLQDPAQVHEAVVADRLLDLRDQFYVLTINFDYVRDGRTGEQISPAHPCICPNCSKITESIMYGEVDDSPQYFCPECWDDSWRPYVEAKLSAEGAD
jgi:hypothetical protein